MINRVLLFHVNLQKIFFSWPLKILKIMTEAYGVF